MRAEFFDTPDRNLLNAFALFLVLAISPHIAAADEPRYPVFIEKKGWGFIDQTGKLVIEPQYAAVHRFAGGLAAVRPKSKWGYIDSSGKIIIAPQFIDADIFSEDLAAVRVTDDESLIKDPYGYIDRSGKLAIPAKYSFAAPFSAGAARVNFENRLIFIDKAGKAIPFPPGINKALGDFSDGLAPVMSNIRSNPPIGYLAPTGKLAIEPQAGYGGTFSEGLAAFAKTTGNFPNRQRTIGFIDTSGKVVFQSEFDNMGQDLPVFSDGLARFNHFTRRPFTTRILYLDKTGKIALEPNLPKLYETFDFHNGLARIRVGGNPDTGVGSKYGYIDKTGKVVIPAKYNFADDFKDGLAQVGTEDSAGYIDTSGKIIWRLNP